MTLAQLSSGEKTLMAVAMSLYTGSRLGEAIELPMVLLLDETDASLHPSMVQSLLSVTNNIFSKRYGVRVILTTHSPSTVALAPEESLYIMRRSGTPRLRRASRDDALKSLTVGIPTLSVRIENRRQVFVESEYDEVCYHEYYRLLKHLIASEFSLQFIASGRGGQGNAQAVKHLVSSLRAAGNDTVLGIVDRDSDLRKWITGRLLTSTDR
ncbi:MAG: ATP-binding protein [Actinomycetota bacterium]|nr:ATP-binding protein [Actinomycetota bacterium]